MNRHKRHITHTCSPPLIDTHGSPCEGLGSGGNHHGNLSGPSLMLGCPVQWQHCVNHVWLTSPSFRTEMYSKPAFVTLAEAFSPLDSSKGVSFVFIPPSLQYRPLHSPRLCAPVLLFFAAVGEALRISAREQLLAERRTWHWGHVQQRWANWNFSVASLAAIWGGGV